MKVEIDVQPLGRGFTGIATYLRNLVPELVRRHPDVALRFVADHPVPELAPAEATLIGPAVTNMKTKLVWETMRLPAHTFASRPDILHVPYHSATAASFARRVMTVHDCYLWSVSPASRADRVYRAALGLAARRARIVVTDSRFSATQIETLLGVDPERIRVVPLACTTDVPRPRTPDEIAACRRRHGIERPFILYAGGTAPHKGIASLVDGYAALDPALRAATDLVLLGRFDRGEAHHRPILDAIAAMPGPGRVMLPGAVPQDDLGTIYQAAQTFVFPSFYEGFGLAPLEAMACGAPVIVSDRASMPEVVGDAGFLVDPARSETITAALNAILPDPERLAAMRAASLARAAHFSWARTADLTRAAYDAALEG